MKIICISDTHGQHKSIKLPEGDMIIHAGDVSGRGKPDEIRDFLKWYASLNYQYKVFIAGNHDFFFEKASNQEIENQIPDNLIYLNDSGVTIEGLNIWGSPVQPWFYDWAFNRQRGAEINKHWDLILDNTDILITHGPVYGYLDRTVRGEPVGCEDLLRKVKEVEPKLFVCGHIHEAYGVHQLENTQLVNASVLDFHYRLTNPPIVIEV
jgi:Icc-related predicted phosphoesterase